MSRGFLTALAALLLGPGVCFAQEIGPVPETCACPPAETSGFYGSSEYLLWWFKNGSVPALVTAGGDGKLGSPGTRVLVNNLDFDSRVRQGGRFTLGYRFENLPSLGAEVNYLFVASRNSTAQFASGGDPVLAQPFTDITNGQPDSSQVAQQGFATGSVAIGSRVALQGAEANLSTSLISSERFRVTVLAGFRYLRLEDEVTSVERFLVLPSVPGFGGNRVLLEDSFRTVNNFYGGQVGLQAGVRFGKFAVDGRAKFALGQVQQVADVAGSATRFGPDGVTTVLPLGGLYALRSNIGRHTREAFAFVPEVGFNVGWQVTPRLTLFTGYSFLWISTVARAGDQIDPFINTAQFPLRSGASPLVSPARPAFFFHQSDFWAQGVNLGLELQF